MGSIKRRPGWVYLLYSAWYYKIGKAIKVKDRVKDLQTASPLQIDLVFAVYHPDHVWLETTLHRLYAKFRTNGEWFEFEPDMVESVIRQMRAYADLGEGQYQYMEGDFVAQTYYTEYKVHISGDGILLFSHSHTCRMRYVPKKFRHPRRPRLIYDDARNRLSVDISYRDEDEVAALPRQWGDFKSVTPEVGMHVYHVTFGIGVIHGVEIMMVDNYDVPSVCVAVQFEDKSRKMLLEFARLDIIGPTSPRAV